MDSDDSVFQNMRYEWEWTVRGTTYKEVLVHLLKFIFGVCFIKCVIPSLQGLSSGGVGYLEQNPQYGLAVSETDVTENDDEEDESKKEHAPDATVIISLLQRGRRQMRNLLKTEHTNIGVTFRIFKVCR